MHTQCTEPTELTDLYIVYQLYQGQLATELYGYSVSMRGCAIGGVHNATLSKIYESGSLDDQTMYTRQVYTGAGTFSGQAEYGIMWAQSGVMG